MAHALDAMQRQLCGSPDAGLCEAMKPVNGTIFMRYLLNVTFRSYSNDPIYFNKNGDPPGRYQIMNYRKVLYPNGSVAGKTLFTYLFM